jgi:hypothetical protein
MQTRFEVPNNVSDLIAALSLDADFAAEVQQHGLVNALTASMDGVMKASDAIADGVRALNRPMTVAEDAKATAKMIECRKAFVMLARARRAARAFDEISSSTGMVIH